jgi:subtilisin family serine protease
MAGYMMAGGFGRVMCASNRSARRPIMTILPILTILSGSVVHAVPSAAYQAPDSQIEFDRPTVADGFCDNRLAIKVHLGRGFEDAGSGNVRIQADEDPHGRVSQVNALLESLAGTSVRRAFDAADTTLAMEIGLDRVYILIVEPGTDLVGLAADLRSFDSVFESVDRVSGGTMDADIDSGTDDSVMLPDDELFPLLYGLENRGQVIWGIQGVVDADIDASRAWQITMGSSDIIVAVVDSGVSLSHPDLAGQFVHGRNFTSGNTEDVDDQFVSHGTHVSGIIGGLLNNSIGVSGVAPGCRIMPIRVMDRFGFTFEEWVADGIIYAVDNGATVLNVSIGFPSASSILRDAVVYAYESGAVICASTGNISTDPIGFPARYAETIAVGATNNQDLVATFTSTGPEMTLSAPGRNIYSTWDTNSEPDTYKRKSGTSFSTPYVTATVALIQSINPSLTPDQVRGVLVRTADDIDAPGWDENSGAGRLNAYKAVSLADSLPVIANPDCLVDLNGDGMIDFADIQIFLAAFASEESLADMNNDGNYDFFDIQIFLAMFGEGCTQSSREP